MDIEAQSIMSRPSKKIRKTSCPRKFLSYEKKAILKRKPKALDKKYVWIPNMNIPTIDLKKPKY